ncbi:uncharacterized protein LOC122264303 isoform X2 [Penaeus japonicus]|uniref:uncharacterized protein LOC122264303 isoform X2 n=1 Tax=Penaeus japonicus TaxID=27405 RepID=UPI001C713B10|nr:uncharacterized protein LOC122264303 isoform X2 [Penaeus japonicus]
MAYTSGVGRSSRVLYLVWSALMGAVMAAGGEEIAQNCMPYPVDPDTSSPAVYMNTNVPLDLDVIYENETTLNALPDLFLNVGSVTVTLQMSEGRVKCNEGRPSPGGGGQIDSPEDEEELGLYRFYVNNSNLLINGHSVCGNVTITEKRFKFNVEKASERVEVAFNCAEESNCDFYNNSFVLDPADSEGTSYVRGFSEDAAAELEVSECPEEDDPPDNLLACRSLGKVSLEGKLITGQALKGDWFRLHFEEDDLQMEATEDSHRIAVLVVGDYMKTFALEQSYNPRLTINNARDMEFATCYKDIGLTGSENNPPVNPDDVWLPVAVVLLILFSFTAILAATLCYRTRKSLPPQEPEAPQQLPAKPHPVLPASPSPSLAEAKTTLSRRYSTLLASDAVAVPNGHPKDGTGGGGHRFQASRDLSGLPDLAPPPLPSSSPPSLPHQLEGDPVHVDRVSVRKTLDGRDDSCPAETKSHDDDWEDDYADPRELEKPSWLRSQDSVDDEEHDYADPRELEAPAWLLNQDSDDDHDYDYIDRDALRIQLDRDWEEKQKRSMVIEDVSLSKHDSENSLYEELKALDEAKENQMAEEQKQREQQQHQNEEKEQLQQRKEEELQPKEEVEEQKAEQEEEEERQQKEEEHQQKDDNQEYHLKDFKEGSLETVYL